MCTTAYRNTSEGKPQITHKEAVLPLPGSALRNLEAPPTTLRAEARELPPPAEEKRTPTAASLPTGLAALQPPPVPVSAIPRPVPQNPAAKQLKPKQAPPPPAVKPPVVAVEPPKLAPTPATVVAEVRKTMVTPPTSSVTITACPADIKGTDQEKNWRTLRVSALLIVIRGEEAAHKKDLEWFDGHLRNLHLLIFDSVPGINSHKSRQGIASSVVGWINRNLSGVGIPEVLRDASRGKFAFK